MVRAGISFLVHGAPFLYLTELLPLSIDLAAYCLSQPLPRGHAPPFAIVLRWGKIGCAPT